MKDIKAVFDIGNDVIKWVVFANDDGKEIILAKQMEPTQGMRKWKILDSEGFVNTINKITESFIKKLGGDFIEEVLVGISHPEMIVNRVVEQKRIMTEEIIPEDVDHLSRVIAEISNKSNFETIKIVPVHFLIDENKREKDPIGMRGKKLELIADVFMIPKNIYNGVIDSNESLKALIGRSSFIRGGHLADMRNDAIQRKIDPDRAMNETDQSPLMEGLYIKVEEDGIVRERMKYVRQDFLSVVSDSESHWAARPIIPNRLIDDSILWR